MKRTMIQTQFGNAHAFPGDVCLRLNLDAQTPVHKPRLVSPLVETGGEIGGSNAP